jgi:hypothetical protein
MEHHPPANQVLNKQSQSIHVDQAETGAALLLVRIQVFNN